MRLLQPWLKKSEIWGFLFYYSRRIANSTTSGTCPGWAVWTCWASLSPKQGLRGCSERFWRESCWEMSCCKVLPHQESLSLARGRASSQIGNCPVRAHVWQQRLRAAQVYQVTRVVFCSSGNFMAGNIMEKWECTATKGPSSFRGKIEHTLPLKMNKHGTSTKQQVSCSYYLQANYKVVEPSFRYPRWFYPKYSRFLTPQHCSKVDFVCSVF